MKTKISELISQKLHLTDPSGNILGEVFMESEGLVKLKVGAETLSFYINRPYIGKGITSPNDTIDFDLSQNQNFRITSVSGSYPVNSALKLNFINYVGIISSGVIIVPSAAITGNIDSYQVINAKVINGLLDIPMSIGNDSFDIFTYMCDGVNCFVSMANSFR